MKPNNLLGMCYSKKEKDTRISDSRVTNIAAVNGYAGVEVCELHPPELNNINNRNWL